jgi:pSer/pThr/pTyr-binding forkhead associated (FHA) protein/tetratricopeptide (TPR) repeat protein
MGEQRVELTIRREGHPDMTVPLPAGSIHIGRAEDNGLVLPDIAVSRRHARLTVSGGGVTIEDVGSGNGTYFEGKPIRKRELQDGDEILIDPFTLSFSIPDSVEREATDTATSESEAGPPRVAGVARLVLVHGTGLRPEYPIRDGCLSMGRAEQRDVVLPDPAASRSHAEIVKQGETWLLKDFGSVNGTFVNSKRVREQVLADGDKIRIGATEFRFESPKAPLRVSAPASSPAPPSPGTKPFENLIFGLEDGQAGLPEGLGSDRTFVPKSAPKDDPPAEPRAQLGAPPSPPPVPARPADDPGFSTRKMAPPQAPLPPPPPALASPPPPAPPAAAPEPPSRPVATPPAAPPPPAPVAAPPALSAPPPVPASSGFGAPPPAAPVGPTLAPPPGVPSQPVPVAAPPPASAPFAAAPLAPPPGVAPQPVGHPGAPPPVQSGFAAPLAPPPAGGPAAPPPPSGTGFGSVEMDMGGGKRGRGRKMKMSSGGGGKKMPKQGTFLQRNIGKLTAGFAVMALLLFSIGFIRNNSSDVPDVKRKASASTEPASVAATSSEGVANQGAIDSLISQGNALFAEKKYLEAVEKYAAVQKLSPNNATATKMGYHACEFMVVQAMYTTLSQRSGALAEQQDAYQAAMEQADEALSSGRGLASAIEDLEKVEQYFPGDQALADALSKLRSRRRGVAHAVRQRQQQEFESSVEDLFARAKSDRNRGDAMAAIQGYERVLAADPDKQTELYWKAEEEIRQIKAELSARGREAYRIGVSAMKSGDYLTARAQFRETLRLDPFNQVAARRQDEVQAKLDQLAQKFWSEAEIYEKTNQLEMAIGRYRKVMEYCASASSPLSQKAKKRIDALMR